MPTHSDATRVIAASNRAAAGVYERVGSNILLGTAELLDRLEPKPQIVTRDPNTLASYDSFVIALFGPQKSGPGSQP